jgi:hypothetical protein
LCRIGFVVIFGVVELKAEISRLRFAGHCNRNCADCGMVRGSDAGIVLIVIDLSMQPVVFENVMLSVSIL